MAKHSCGHKAGPFTPASAVRNMPRCTDCQAKAELEAQLELKAQQLAALYPNKSPEEIGDMIFSRSHKTYVRGVSTYNLHQLIAAADDIMSAHAAYQIDSEEDYVEGLYYDPLHDVS